MSIYAIDPHGCRLDREHNSDTGGTVFAFIILVIVGVFYIIMKSNNYSSKRTSSTQQLTEAERWELRIKQMEKEDKDLRTGCSWALWILGIWLSIFLLNYFFKIF